MDKAHAALAKVYGFASFRPGQEEILSAVLAGDNILAIMPTGSGKSLCYQLPAIIRPGLTIVVSPLIALMRDQVGQLRDYGVAAAALNSANSSRDTFDVEDMLRNRKLRLLYVAPERLVRTDTQALLREAGADVMAIDEAHCVSQWGHDFRPEYRGLRQMGEAIGIRQTIAVTATADGPTRADIAERLFEREPKLFLRSFDRPNLRLAMQTRSGGVQQIAAKVAAHKGESGIVYCSSRKGVESLAESLRILGHWALPYHAGMDPGLRSSNQDEFLQNDGVVMVATVAFGMGIDKPDVRYVCHANLPSSIEAYYQEIGRAGRDGLPADTLTLYNGADIVLRQRQIYESDAPPERKRIDEHKLECLIALCETPRCRRQTLLSAFGEASPGKCGNCDICEGRHAFFNGTIAAQKAMSAILRTRGRFFAGHLVNVLIGKATEAITRHGHNLLPTFGAGPEYSAPEWRRIFHQLQAAELIMQDLEDRGVWVVTPQGRAVLKGEAQIELRGVAGVKPAQKRDMRRVLENIDAEARPVRSQVPEPEASGPLTITGERLSVAQSTLLLALKARRAEIARERKIPAYVIFHDRTLIEMAVRAPRTAAEFATVHGVGDAKVTSYADVFLDVIARLRE